jgi:hypothetical protein
VSAICLISALAYHEIITQVPHEVYVALERGTEAPRLSHPPIRVFWFSGQAFTLGIQTHKIDGVPVRIYSPEKTIADCFKCGTAGSGRCLQTNLESAGTMVRMRGEIEPFLLDKSEDESFHHEIRAIKEGLKIEFRRCAPSYLQPQLFFGAEGHQGNNTLLL